MTMLTQQEFVQIMYGLHHVKRARDWGEGIGLMYSFKAATDFYGATTEGNDLTAFGWTVTGAPPYIASSAADFLTSDDKGTTGGVHLDTASDVIQSPAIFGDYAYVEPLCHMLGRVSGNGTPDLPRFLIADFGARFSANNAETGTGIGFVEDGGSAAVANDHMAAIATDGTNWVLRSGAATSSAIAVDDTNYHHFRIVVDRVADLAYGYVDDMAKSAGQSIAIQDDEWPVCFGAGTVSAGSNDPVLNWAIVRYAWHGWV